MTTDKRRFGTFPPKPPLTRVRRVILSSLFGAGMGVRRLLPRRDIDLDDIQRILVTRWCCIGDILQTTPLVRALRKRFPDARIDYMTGSWSRSVLENNPHIDEILPYPSEGYVPHGAERAQLRQRGYDMVFVCHESFPATKVAHATGARYRIGFDAYNRGVLLTHALPRSADDPWHLIEAYLELARMAGIPDDGPEMELVLTSEEMAWAREFLNGKSLPSGSRIVCLFPGGGSNPGTEMPIKRWLPSKFAELADHLAEECGASILLCGGSGDREVIAEVKNAMRSEAACAAGESALRQSAALFKCSSLFIGNDTGPLHMAAAAGTPTIGIFGPSDPVKVAPLGSKHVGLRADIGCEPCFRITIGGSAICPEIPCMRQLPVDRVLQEAKRLLRSES